MQEKRCAVCKYDFYQSHQCEKCVDNDKCELITNAENIRRMSDEELVDWIVRHDEKSKQYGYWDREKISEFLKKTVE